MRRACSRFPLVFPATESAVSAARFRMGLTGFLCPAPRRHVDLDGGATARRRLEEGQLEGDDRHHLQILPRRRKYNHRMILWVGRILSCPESSPCLAIQQVESQKYGWFW